MTRRKDPVARTGQLGRIELQLHQLVHVAHHDHVAVELDDALKLDQREGRQLGPAVVEARVRPEVALPPRRREPLDGPAGDAARRERRDARGWEGRRVERQERVPGLRAVERVGQRQEAGEV